MSAKEMIAFLPRPWRTVLAAVVAVSPFVVGVVKAELVFREQVRASIATTAAHSEQLRGLDDSLGTVRTEQREMRMEMLRFFRDFYTDRGYDRKANEAGSKEQALQKEKNP